jgi:hypothetical protein
MVHRLDWQIITYVAVSLSTKIKICFPLNNQNQQENLVHYEICNIIISGNVSYFHSEKLSSLHIRFAVFKMVLNVSSLRI